MNLKHAHHLFDGISQFITTDPSKIRLLSDRVLIRDIAEQEQDMVNGVAIPEVAREKTAAGKDGRLRLGVVVAVGPGDQFLEHGLSADGQVRRTLITAPCPVCETGRTFDARAYEFVDCPECEGTSRIPVVVPPQCKPGDTVLYDRRKEAEVYIEGSRYSLVHAEQSVWAVIEIDPKLWKG